MNLNLRVGKGAFFWFRGVEEGIGGGGCVGTGCLRFLFGGLDKYFRGGWFLGFCVFFFSRFCGFYGVFLCC